MSPSVTCVFCKRSDEDEITGKMQRTLDGTMVAHYNCTRSPANQISNWENCPQIGVNWKRKIVIRKSGVSEGHRDVYYLSPEGKTLRSKKEIERHLVKSLDSSLFLPDRTQSLTEQSDDTRAGDALSRRRDVTGGATGSDLFSYISEIETTPETSAKEENFTEKQPASPQETLSTQMNAVPQEVRPSTSGQHMSSGTGSEESDSILNPKVIKVFSLSGFPKRKNYNSKRKPNEKLEEILQTMASPDRGVLSQMYSELGGSQQSVTIELTANQDHQNDNMAVEDALDSDVTDNSSCSDNTNIDKTPQKLPDIGVHVIHSRRSTEENHFIGEHPDRLQDEETPDRMSAYFPKKRKTTDNICKLISTQSSGSNIEDRSCRSTLDASSCSAKDLGAQESSETHTSGDLSVTEPESPSCSPFILERDGDKVDVSTSVSDASLEKIENNIKTLQSAPNGQNRGTVSNILSPQQRNSLPSKLGTLSEPLRSRFPQIQSAIETSKRKTVNNAEHSKDDTQNQLHAAPQLQSNIESTILSPGTSEGQVTSEGSPNPRAKDQPRSSANQPVIWEDCPEVGDGCKQRIVLYTSGKYNGRKYVTYFSPKGEMFRSKKKLQIHMDNSMGPLSSMSKDRRTQSPAEKNNGTRAGDAVIGRTDVIVTDKATGSNNSEIEKTPEKEPCMNVRVKLKGLPAGEHCTSEQPDSPQENESEYSINTGSIWKLTDQEKNHDVPPMKRPYSLQDQDVTDLPASIDCLDDSQVEGEGEGDGGNSDASQKDHPTADTPSAGITYSPQATLDQTSEPASLSMVPINAQAGTCNGHNIAAAPGPNNDSEVLKNLNRSVHVDPEESFLQSLVPYLHKIPITCQLKVKGAIIAILPP